MTTDRRRTATTVVLLSCITVAAGLMGLVREQIIASSFGASSITDAYISAQYLPILLDSMIGAAVASVLVPLFTAARSDGENRLASLLYTSLVCLGSLYFLEMLILWTSSPWLIRVLAPGLSPLVMHRGIGVALIFAPATLFLGISSLITAALNVHQRFLLPAAVVLAPNIAVIVATLLFRPISVEQVAWAIFTGYAVQSILLLIQLRSTGISLRGQRVDWVTAGQAFKLALPIMLANAVAQITPTADKFLASHMSAGSIAALNYANRLIQFPVNVLVLGLSTVLFARFSQMALDEKSESLANEVGRTVQQLMFVLLPISGLTMVLAHPLVAVVFQRGHFDQRAVEMTGSALSFYAVGLIPMAVIPVLGRTLFALRNTQAQFRANVLASAVYLVSALLLRSVLTHRALALAFALGQLAACFVLGAVLTARLGSRPLKMVAHSLPISIAATLIACLCCWGATLTLANPYAETLAGGLAGLVAYIAVHLLLHSEESNLLRTGLRLAKNRLAMLRQSN